MTDLLICVDRKKAAAMCMVSPTHFDAHIRPKLTPVRIGRCVRFHVRQLQDLLDSEAGIEPQSAVAENGGDGFEAWAEGFDGGA